MTLPREVFLSRCEYHLGHLVTLDELPLVGEERDALHEQGLATVSRIDMPLSELLPELLCAHIDQHGAPDFIVVVSNSLNNADIGAITRGLARSATLAALPMQFVNSGDCTNFHHVLRLGWAYLHAELGRDVLLVTADRAVDAVGGEIRAEFGGGLVGDAVALCRQGLAPQSRGWRLLSAPVIVKDATEAVNIDARLALSVQGLRRAARAVMPERGMAAEIDQLIPNTYTRQSAELLSLATRVPEERIFLGNVARTGHCFAADNLINLVDYADGAHAPGSQLLMVASGVFQWSAVLLERAPQHSF